MADESSSSEEREHREQLTSEELMSYVQGLNRPNPLGDIVDSWRRVTTLSAMLKQGAIQLAEDKEHVVFVHGDSFVESYFRGMLPLRGFLTSEGRAQRRTVKALREQWRQTGRILFD